MLPRYERGWSRLIVRVIALVTAALPGVATLSGAAWAGGAPRVPSAGDIAVSPPGEPTVGFWVARDPINGRSLVLWLAQSRPRGQGVFVRLTGADGRPLGEPVEVGEGMSAGVDFDPDSQRYLVVTVQVGVIWGRLLDADGKVLGDPFPIAAFWYPRNAIARHAVVTAAPGHGLFLVAWSDNRNWGDATDDVFVQRVTADGRLLGPARPALADTRRTEYIGWRSVLFDRRHRRFAVVWEETDPWNLRYRFIDVDGRMGPAEALDIPGVQPAVALDGKRGRILLVWEDKPNREPRYRLYDLDFRPLGPVRRLPGRQRGVDQPSPAYDPVSGRYLISWRNDYDPYFYGQWVTADGAPDGEPFIGAELVSFSQRSFPVPRSGGGILLFYQDATVPRSSRYDVIRVRTVRPSDRRKPAQVSRHPDFR